MTIRMGFHNRSHIYSWLLKKVVTRRDLTVMCGRYIMLALNKLLCGKVTSYILLIIFILF